MKNCKCCLVCHLTQALVLIGAFNWGLIGLGHFSGNPINIVHFILGFSPLVENVVYVLVGVAAVATAINMCPCQKNCGGDCKIETKKK